MLWVNEFNCLRENIFIDKWQFGNNVAFMDLHIFKGENFYNGGKLSIKVYQKPENKYMYIPYKSAHPRHTIKNYVIGELKRYVRVNTEELNFLKIKNRFFLRMRNRGFNKIKLSHWFSEVQFSSSAKFLSTTQKIIVIFRVREKQRQILVLFKLQRESWQRL